MITVSHRRAIAAAAPASLAAASVAAAALILTALALELRGQARGDGVRQKESASPAVADTIAKPLSPTTTRKEPYA